MPIGPGLAILLAGGLSAGASAFAGSTESAAAQSAAAQQAAVAQAGQQIQQNEFNTIEGQLSPFISAGEGGANALTTMLGTGSGGNPATSPLLSNYPSFQPFQPTMAQLEGTPGYQFTLDQGLKANQNSFASQGGSESGAAVKGAESFATGLASTTYNQQLQNYLAQQQQGYNQNLSNRQFTYNALTGLTGIGESAAAQSGVTGSNITSNIANLIGQQGQSGAAGTVGSANAIAGAASGIGGSLNSTALTYALLNGRTDTNFASLGPSTIQNDLNNTNNQIASDLGLGQ